MKAIDPQHTLCVSMLHARHHIVPVPESVWSLRAEYHNERDLHGIGANHFSNLSRMFIVDFGNSSCKNNLTAWSISSCSTGSHELSLPCCHGIIDFHVFLSTLRTSCPCWGIYNSMRTLQTPSADEERDDAAITSSRAATKQRL